MGVFFFMNGMLPTPPLMLKCTLTGVQIWIIGFRIQLENVLTEGKGPVHFAHLPKSGLWAPLRERKQWQDTKLHSAEEH